VEPRVEPSRKGDIVHSWASVDLISQALGYETAVSVDEGMEMSLDWYLENLKP
jgi:nucleoside-diphosphate-sugar epimerase